jgi:hypothetical protein
MTVASYEKQQRGPLAISLLLRVIAEAPELTGAALAELSQWTRSSSRDETGGVSGCALRVAAQTVPGEGD